MGKNKLILEKKGGVHNYINVILGKEIEKLKCTESTGIEYGKETNYSVEIKYKYILEEEDLAKLILGYLVNKNG